MSNVGRYIVIVLDSFGVGAMEDVPEVRPADTNSNTALNKIEKKANFLMPVETIYEVKEVFINRNFMNKAL